MAAKLFKSLVVTVSLLAASTVAANVGPGVKAFERGHPSSALRSWLPLARGGNPKAQNNVGLMYERGSVYRKATQKRCAGMLWRLTRVCRRPIII